MRRILGCLVLAALAGAGCTSTTQPPPAGGLHINATVQPDSVGVGTGTTITVSVTNPTGAPVTTIGTSGCRFRFRIVDTQGAIVGAPQQVCTADTPTLVLAPGQTISEKFTWDGARAGSIDALGAGSYTVYGTFLFTPGGDSPARALKIGTQ